MFSLLHLLTFHFGYFLVSSRITEKALDLAQALGDNVTEASQRVKLRKDGFFWGGFLDQLKKNSWVQNTPSVN